MRWAPLFSVCLALVVAACGGGPMSETEYVESLNSLVVETGAKFEASYAAYDQIADPTLDDFIDLVEEQLVFEYEVRELFETFDPPDSIDEVNQIMVDTLARLIAAAEELADAAEGVSSLEEIERTPEFAEYQGVNTDADRMCLDVEAKLNDVSAGPAIEGPWLSDLQRTVRAFIDCEDTATG